jgi:putative PIN family toxin of toxin-antitoxin system
VSGLISPRGTPAQIVAAAEEGRYELIVSNMVLEELKLVLVRPKFRRYVPEAAVEVYLTRVERAASMIVGQTPTTEHYGPDPKDDYLISLTLASGAHVLVSGDTHLLDLETDLTSGISVPIITPHEFLEQVKRSR